MKIIKLPLLALAFVLTQASCGPVSTPFSQPPQAPAASILPANAEDNGTSPATRYDPGSKPGRQYVRISDRIGSRDPNSPDCEYYIKVQNLHDRWSLINVAVDINGTIYLISEIIKPGGVAEFYRRSLPRPQTSCHVFYDWQPPG